MESLANEIGLDADGLVSLESKVHEHSGLFTLARYAAALGKRLVWTLEDIEPKTPKA